ncbi:MAG: DUF4432 family protein [Fretibacterium sp.]|nr:DUF4432 family protein [Fretibacterium sp.]
MSGRIELQRKFFSEEESLLLRWGAMEASLFLYPSGVSGVRVKNRRGEIVVLPWNGQMIWNAVFDGHDLKMKNMFPDPVDTTVLVDTYGAFLAHCGARRMGTPTPEDDHPLHGELPCARYQEAALTFGQDEDGRRWLGVTGVYHYKQGFGDFYDATPEVRLFEDDTLLDISLSVQNVGNYPMDLMYMCHCNFLAGDDTRIVQTCGWDPESMVLRTSIPAHVKPSPKFLEFLEALKGSAERTAVLRAEDEYDPEIVFFLRGVKPASDGKAHIMQVFPDGYSHIVSYDPGALDHHVRWILKNKDQKVLGILPSTAESEGHTTEKAKGKVRTLNPGAIARFQVTAGLLDPERTRAMEALVASAMKD